MAFNKPFTEKEKDFILQNFAGMSIAEMARKLGRSDAATKKWSLKLGLRRANRYDWTQIRTQILIDMYPNHSAPEIAEILETEIYVVYKKAQNLGLKKDAEYLKALNRRMGEQLQKGGYGTRFVKGQKSWNKGKKLPSHPNSVKTQFKKGEKPFNFCKIGDLRKPDRYWKIKIADPNIWEFLHIYIWTKKHGEIKKGLCCVFKDNNPDNCRLENLELITRSELAVRNSIHNLPPEIVELKQTLGRLKRQINKLEKNNYAEK